MSESDEETVSNSDVDALGLQTGTKIGPYKIIRKLGAGGMGIVYEGVHEQLNKPIALKTLHAQYAQDKDVLKRFLREGKAAASLNHPNVVTVDDIGVLEGIPYLAMELLPGLDLGQTLKAHGRLSAEAAADVLIPVLSAIGAAHRIGIVHRDLKPENIFLAETQWGITPKVLDFGISKTAEDAALGLTGTKAMLGTPYYMAPEQFEGAREADRRSDLFSMGVIAYECITGDVPFKADSIWQLCSVIKSEPPLPPRERAPDIPPEFEALLERAMQKAPDARYQSAEEFALALLPLAGERIRLTYEEALAPHQSTYVGAVPSPSATEAQAKKSVSTKPDGTRSSPGSLLQASATIGDIPTQGTQPWVWVALALAAGSALYFAFRPGVPLPEVSVNPANSVTTPELPDEALEPGPSAPSVVTVKINPQSALVILDGHVVEHRPIPIPLDGKPHTLVASKAGYETKELELKNEFPPLIQLKATPREVEKTTKAKRSAQRPAKKSNQPAASKPRPDPKKEPSRPTTVKRSTTGVPIFH